MRDRLRDLGTAAPPIELVVVTFTDAVERLAAHRRHLGLDGPLVGDPDRRLYRAVGAGQGRRRDVWSRGTLAAYARLIRRGRRLQRSDGDTRQLGADIVIDPTGVVRRVWLPSGPDRRPAADEIVAAAIAATRRR